MKYLAAVIELNGEMKNLACEAWRRFKCDQNISFISDHSPCPHIMLVSGVPLVNKDLFEKVLDDIGLRHKGFKVKGDGLGVFVREQPVIYIRWMADKNLMLLQKDILKGMNKDIDYNWIAKTSLAYKDSSYEKLHQSLILLSDLDFSLTLDIRSIALYQIEQGMPEIKLQDFNLKN